MNASECNTVYLESEGGVIQVRAHRKDDRVELLFPDGNGYVMTRRLGAAMMRAFISTIPDISAVLDSLPDPEVVPTPVGDA